MFSISWRFIEKRKKRQQQELRRRTERGERTDTYIIYTGGRENSCHGFTWDEIPLENLSSHRIGRFFFVRSHYIRGPSIPVYAEYYWGVVALNVNRSYDLELSAPVV